MFNRIPRFQDVPVAWFLPPIEIPRETDPRELLGMTADRMPSADNPLVALIVPVNDKIRNLALDARLQLLIASTHFFRDASAAEKEEAIFFADEGVQDFRQQQLSRTKELPHGSYEIVLFPSTTEELATLRTQDLSAHCEAIKRKIGANSHRLTMSVCLPVPIAEPNGYKPVASALVGAGIGYFASNAYVSHLASMSASNAPIVVAGMSAKLFIAVCTFSVAAVALLLFLAYKCCKPYLRSYMSSSVIEASDVHMDDLRPLLRVWPNRS